MDIYVDFKSFLGIQHVLHKTLYNMLSSVVLGEQYMYHYIFIIRASVTSSFLFSQVSKPLFSVQGLVGPAVIMSNTL